MKNILLITMGIFLLTSCSKDSIDIGTEGINSPEKSEIKVRVSTLEWKNESCELGCGATSQYVTFISNAEVLLYEGSIGINDGSAAPLASFYTDNEGGILIEELEPGQYTVLVKTPVGNKHRFITTQLHRRSSIDFSF